MKPLASFLLLSALLALVAPAHALKLGIETYEHMDCLSLIRTQANLESEFIKWDTYRRQNLAQQQAAQNRPYDQYQDTGTHVALILVHGLAAQKGASNMAQVREAYAIASYWRQQRCRRLTE